MAVKTLPLELVLVAYSRTTFHREFRWRPDGVTLQDFTGWSATLLIGKQSSPAVLALDTTGPGLQLTATGQILVTLTPEETGALHGGLFYQLDLADPGGNVIRFLRGQLNVIHDVEPPS